MVRDQCPSSIVIVSFFVYIFLFPVNLYKYESYALLTGNKKE